MIKENVAKNKWFYVPTSENPTDITTRPLSLQKVIENELWWKGPAFLSHSDNHFPFQSYSSHSHDFEEEQVISIVVLSKETVGIGSVIDFAGYGSFNKLIHVTLYGL